MIGPKKLRITSDGKSFSVKVETEDGVDLTAYFKRVSIEASRGGTVAKLESVFPLIDVRAPIESLEAPNGSKAEPRVRDWARWSGWLGRATIIIGVDPARYGNELSRIRVWKLGEPFRDMDVPDDWTPGMIAGKVRLLADTFANDFPASVVAVVDESGVGRAIVDIARSRGLIWVYGLRDRFAQPWNQLDTDCPVCGVKQVDTADGTTCPAGHPANPSARHWARLIGESGEVIQVAPVSFKPDGTGEAFFGSNFDQRKEQGVAVQVTTDGRVRIQDSFGPVRLPVGELLLVTIPKGFLV